MPELDPLDSAIDQVAGAKEASAPPDALDSAIDRVSGQERQTSQLRQSVYGALPVEPDRYARAKTLQKTTGVPAETIERNMDEVERNARVNALDILLNDSPVLRAKLSDRDFALQTHDDAEKLRDVELATTGLGRRLKTEDDFKRMAAFPAAFAPKRTLGDQAVTVGRASAATVPRLSKWGYTAIAAGLGLGRSALDLFSGENAAIPLLPTNPLAPLEDLAKYAAQTQEQLVQQVKGEMPADASLVEQGVVAGVESAVQQTELMLAAIAARNPAAVLPAMAAGTGVESYYKGAIEGKLDPSTATVYGVADAQVEYWTEKVPIQRLFGDISAGKSLMKTVARQMAVEIPGEQAATILQDFNEWVFLNPEKTLKDYIAERPSAAAVTLVATVVGTAGNVAATSVIDRFSRDNSRARRAQEHSELLGDLLKMAEASATHQRAPETFQQFMQEAAAETDNLHIDANVLLQEVGPEKIAQIMPSVVPQLATAVASGGTVNVPLAEAISGLAGSGLEEKLLPHLKTSPNAMSQAEAETYLQTEGTRLKEETQKILAEAEDQDAFAQSAQKVHDTFLEELKSANRFRSEVNENYATLVSSFYTVLAGRMGTTPEEMYARYPLRVRAQAPTDVENVLTHAQSAVLDARIDAAIGKLAVGTTIIESRDRDGYRIARKEGGGYVITPVGEQSRIKKREVDEAGARQFLAEQYGALLLEQGAKVQTSTPEFKAWFGDSKVVDEKGESLVVYHGAKRPDRIGTRFRKSRATSGPMSFFTDDPEIASKYAEGKQDTSLEHPSDYAGWFKFKPEGSRSEVDIDRAWYFLTSEERERVAETLPHVTNYPPDGDEMDAGQYRLGGADEFGLSGKDHWDWNIRQAQGNVLKAAKEIWLNSGSLIRSEEEFLDVLRLGGIPMERTRFDSPHAEYPAVLPVYLSIKNPLVTSEIPESVLAALEQAVKRTRTRTREADRGSDLWAKTNRDPKDWVRQLREDVVAGTNSHVWTSIPDIISRKLKELGYDGIQDTGGKRGGTEHSVWVPFEEGQVKSAIGNRGTFDPNDANILNQNVADPDASLRALARYYSGRSWGSEDEARENIRRYLSEENERQAGVFPPTDLSLIDRLRFKKAAGGKVRVDMDEHQAPLPGPVFFSQALRVAESLPASMKAPRAQWIKTLLNKGVKQEEIDWIALEEMPDGAITQPELVAYVRANELQLETTELSGEGSKYGQAEVQFMDFTSEDSEDDIANPYAVIVDYDVVAQFASERAADIRAEEINADRGENGPRYADSSYVFPGGENHVELVLSLPLRTVVGETRHVYTIGPSGRIDEPWMVTEVDTGVEMRFKSQAKADAYVDRHEVQRFSETKGQIDPYDQDDTTHYGDIGEGTAVAWIRANDRVGPNGEKIFFIEEIQSKRHQDGRKQGYKRVVSAEDKAATKRALKKRKETFNALIEAFHADDELRPRWSGKNPSEFVAVFENPLTADAADRWVMSDATRVAARAHAEASAKLTAAEANTPNQTEAVPDAPFKKTWPELALKRAIRYAAERGYDQVAWTTGEQQATRYNLSKHVSRVALLDRSKVGEKPLLIAYNKNGSPTISRPVFDEDEAADIVGPELAATLFEAPLDQEVNGFPARHAQGEDLVLGGEGMKAFYDKQLVDVANKLGKKYGARVEETTIKNGKERRPAAYRVRESHDTPGTWAVTIVEPHGLVYQDGIEDREKAEELANNLNDNAPRTPPIQVREAVHSLPLTDALKAAALGPGFPLFQKARGQISFGSDMAAAPSVISLFKEADLSTFLHEAGHFFLQVYVDVASQPDAPLVIQADLNAFFEWTGVKNLTEWQSMSFEQKRAHHEKFARGFESYLFDGKAPSPQVRGLFERFRAWLLNVYRHATALDVELNPEMRALFDRMLATDEQIEQAEADRNYEALFTTPPKGMDTASWGEYQALGLEATADAKKTLEKRALRDMRWLSNLKSREMRRLKRDVAAKRKAERVLAEEEVRAQQVYAVQHFLRTGEAPLEVTGRLELGPSHKLDLDALKVEYPDGEVGIDDQYDIAALGRMVGKDGIPPATVAQLFGYSSTDHMLKDILAAPAEREAVEALTDQHMLEKYGDITSPDSLERAAEAAIHNEARARFLETEINALAEATGSPKVLRKAAKAFAEATVARRKIKDVRPAPYEAAETKAGKAAMDAMRAGDLELAAVQKRNQLVNHYGQRAATAAQQEVERAVRYLKKVVDSEKIDVEYRDQIAALLDRFELRRITQKEAKRRASLLEWVQAQQEQGIEPLIDGDLLNEAARQQYTEMTLEEFRGLVDAVKNIEHIGRLKHKLLTAVKQKQLDAAAEEIALGIEQHTPGRKPVKIEKTAFDRTMDGIDAIFASHRKVASLARVMDGQQDGGPVWQYIIRGLNAAGDREATLREQATTKLSKLLEGDVGKDFAKQVHIPEIGTSLSREARIVIALNTGNEGNMQRLQDGEGWTDAQVQAVVDTLSKDDIELVNNIFAFLEGYRAAIGAKEKRVSGVEPEWVQGTPLEAKNGTIKGGYFPIKYDPDRSSRAESDSLAETIKQSMLGAYTRATTRRGHTKARAEKVTNRPVRKDLGVLFEHTSQVIHDLAFHEYLIDANRLLRHPRVDVAIREHHGPEVLRQFKALINDVAAGDLAAENWIERGVNHIRTGATVAGLAWNLTTSLLQPLGLTQSIVRIGPKWVGRGMSRWLRDASTMENTAAWIQSKSEFMRLRGKTMQREINEIRNKVHGKESAIQASFFYLIQKMQLVADIPTWLGQYEKAMESGVDEAEAIAQADQAVIDSQAAGQIKDLAQVQRGNAWSKLFTNFYSFFSTTYSQMAEVKARTNLRDPLSVGRAAADYMLLISVPAVLSMMIKEGMGGGGDDDDFWKRALKAQLSYLMGVMVGLRDLGQVVQGYDYRGPAGLRVFQELSRLYTQAGQGELDEAALKALNAAAGVLLHYPAGQVERTMTGLIALIEDDTDNPLALVAGKPKK